jgi:hypothetical protein
MEMLSDEILRRQNMCMGGPLHWEKPPEADGTVRVIHVRRDGYIHTYELRVVDMGNMVIRYYYVCSADDVDPNDETKAPMEAIQ